MATTFPIRKTRYTGTWGSRCRLYLADRFGNRLEELAPNQAITGTITANEDTEIRKRLALTLNDPKAREPFGEWVIPEITLITPDGTATTRMAGLYMLTPPNVETNRARQFGALEGLDLTYLAARSSVGAYTFPIGTDTGEAARTVLLGAGYLEAQLEIPNTGVLLTAAKTPDPGDNRLKVATDLLNAGNWYAPWMTWRGTIKSMAYQNLQAVTPRVTYRSGQGSTVRVPIRETPDWSRLKNAVTVRNLRPNEAPIYWTARITNPAHKLYYNPADPSVGYGIELAGEPVNDPDVPDEATARARAEALLSEAASYYVKLNLDTFVDLEADLHDVIGLEIARGQTVDYSGNWWSRTFTVRLGRITSITSREIYRVEDVA